MNARRVSGTVAALLAIAAATSLVQSGRRDHPTLTLSGSPPSAYPLGATPMVPPADEGARPVLATDPTPPPFTIPEREWYPPPDDLDWPTLAGPREVLVGEPFTVTGVCPSAIANLDVAVGLSDLTEPGWTGSLVPRSDEPWPPTPSWFVDANGSFTLDFTGYAQTATLYIGANCGFDMCSDTLQNWCYLFPDRSVVEIHIVIEYTIPPTR